MFGFPTARASCSPRCWKCRDSIGGPRRWDFCPGGAGRASRPMGRAWGGCAGAGEVTRSLGRCSGSDPGRTISPSEGRRIPGEQGRREGRRAVALRIGVNFQDDAPCPVGGCAVPPRTEITGGEKGGTQVWLFLPLPRSRAVNWRSLSGHREKYQEPAKQNNRSFHC